MWYRHTLYSSFQGSLSVQVWWHWRAVGTTQSILICEAHREWWTTSVFMQGNTERERETWTWRHTHAHDYGTQNVCNIPPVFPEKNAGSNQSWGKEEGLKEPLVLFCCTCFSLKVLLSRRIPTMTTRTTTEDRQMLCTTVSSHCDPKWIAMSSFFVILLLHVLHTWIYIYIYIFSCPLLDDDEEHYQSFCKSITSRFRKRLYPIVWASCLIDSIFLAFADKSILRK